MVCLKYSFRYFLPLISRVYPFVSYVSFFFVLSLISLNPDQIVESMKDSLELNLLLRCCGDSWEQGAGPIKMRRHKNVHPKLPVTSMWSVPSVCFQSSWEETGANHLERRFSLTDLCVGILSVVRNSRRCVKALHPKLHQEAVCYSSRYAGTYLTERRSCMRTRGNRQTISRNVLMETSVGQVLWLDAVNVKLQIRPFQ